MTARLSAATLDFDTLAVAAAARERIAGRLGGNANDNRAPGVATPFSWQDPATIARREWLGAAGHYIRGFVTATVAPGGVGKSANAIVEALAMVTGYPLPLRGLAREKLRVWYCNGEDPIDEIQRRFQAAMLHFKIKPDEVAGRLFIDSGHEQNFVFAKEDRNGVAIAVPVVASVTESIKANGIDCLILDPFISFHELSENDNSKMQRVVTQLAYIAKETNASVELIAHAKKLSGREMTADDVRGASALHDKARSLRTINRISEDEAARAGLAPGDHRSIMRIDMGKSSMAPPGSGSTFRKLVSVDLGNGDSVGVVTDWHFPSAEESAIDATAEQIESIRGRLTGASAREDMRSKLDFAHFMLRNRALR
ncbi:MAG: AAA family ATPase [Roseiarcus sp.]|jgi:hypothetical protein